MRFLVLGGSGFLGRSTAHWLVRRGHSVRSFDLATPQLHDATGPAVEYVEGNFLNPSDVEAALHGGIEVVLHFISTTVPATSIDNVPVEVETNVLATVRLLDLMARREIRRIGFPSSGGTIYAAGPEPHTEDEIPAPTCPYGLGKLMIEQTLHFYRSRHGIEHQIWRISNPYGDVCKTHASQGAIDAFLYKVRAGLPIQLWGQGKAVRDFIFVDDVAEAIGRLLESDRWGVTVNVGSGGGVSIAQVVDLIRRVVPCQVAVEMHQGYTGPSHAVLDTNRLQQLVKWKPAFDLAAGVSEAWKRLHSPKQ